MLIIAWYFPQYWNYNIFPLCYLLSNFLLLAYYFFHCWNQNQNLEEKTLRHKFPWKVQVGVSKSSRHSHCRQCKFLFKNVLFYLNPPHDIYYSIKSNRHLPEVHVLHVFVKCLFIISFSVCLLLVFCKLHGSKTTSAVHFHGHLTLTSPQREKKPWVSTLIWGHFFFPRIIFSPDIW